MNIVRYLLIQDSDISAEVEEIEDEDSENEDCCEICGDYG